MARRNNDTRFSIYDEMERKGVFDENSANVSSENYQRQEYPKMFYHPQGEQRITRPGEVIQTPLGPKVTGELRETIFEIANNASEEKALRAAKWHDNPADAEKAGGRKPGHNVKSQSQRIADLEQELAMLKGVDAEPERQSVAPQIVA